LKKKNPKHNTFKNKSVIPTLEHAIAAVQRKRLTKYSDMSENNSQCVEK